MVQTGFQMSPSRALRCVWLICGCITLGEFAMDINAAHKKRCHYRKTCMEIEYDIREAVCCETHFHVGPELSCCGKQPYNSAVATCCKAHGITAIIGGLSEKVSACCGLEAYNPLNEMCCQSTVIPKPVPKAQCCGKGTFDEETQLCCGPIDNKKILTKNSTHDLCCGHKQYDSRTHCCCFNNNINNKKNTGLRIRLKQSKCCVKNSGQTQGLRHNPLEKQLAYNGSEACDVERYLCCGSNIKKILLRKSSHHQCCGHDQYDTKTECCCWINETVQVKSSNCCVNDVRAMSVQPQTPAPQPVCTEPHTRLCGSSCYNPDEFHCCERKQTQKQWCCKSGRCDVTPTLYNPRTQVCCDGCVSEWKPGIDQCCGQTTYGLAQHGVLCCKNTLYTDRENAEECSETCIPYNPAEGTICCSHFRGSPGQHCCGTETYQPDYEICCDGHRHPKAEHGHCCGIQAYNVTDPQMKCCAGTLHNLTSLGNRWQEAQCCGSSLLKPQEVCCSGEDKALLYSEKGSFRCCGHLYFNTSLWSCCAGKLSPIYRPALHQDKGVVECIFLSVNNVNKTELCNEINIGTVESVSLHSIVFSSVMKINGTRATVKALPSPHILKTPDHCRWPKLIPGKTYFFDQAKVYFDFNHDSTLQSLHFIISKCHP